MNCNEANSILCTHLLEALNIKFKKSGAGHLLSAPYRQDKNPSLYIVENRWKDMATGEYGRTVDLAAKILGLPVTETLKSLKSLFQGQFLKSESHTMNTQYNATENGIVVLAEIQDPRLRSYILSRRIPPELANKYCREIHYSVGDKNFFSIGFENDAGGYATRNEYSKRCVGVNSITTIIRDESVLLVCEGFIDYLSAIVINQGLSGYSAIVMNSTANTTACVKRIMNLNPKQMYLALDNDDAGRKSLQQIRAQFKNAIDLSPKYNNFKDVNDYLIHLK